MIGQLVQLIYKEQIWIGKCLIGLLGSDARHLSGCHGALFRKCNLEKAGTMSKNA